MCLLFRKTAALLSVDRAGAQLLSTHAKFKTVLSRLGWLPRLTYPDFFRNNTRLSYERRRRLLRPVRIKLPETNVCSIGVITAVARRKIGTPNGEAA
jgi:hypothetical protein